MVGETPSTQGAFSGWRLQPRDGTQGSYMSWNSVPLALSAKCTEDMWPRDSAWWPRSQLSPPGLRVWWQGPRRHALLFGALVSIEKQPTSSCRRAWDFQSRHFCSYLKRAWRPSGEDGRVTHLFWSIILISLSPWCWHLLIVIFHSVWGIPSSWYFK